MTERNKLIIKPPDLGNKKGVLNWFLRAIQKDIGFVPKSELQSRSGMKIPLVSKRVVDNK
jgi:hypothetical protein